MLENLLTDHESIIRLIKKDIEDWTLGRYSNSLFSYTSNTKTRKDGMDSTILYRVTNSLISLIFNWNVINELNLIF